MQITLKNVISTAAPKLAIRRAAHVPQRALAALCLQPLALLSAPLLRSVLVATTVAGTALLACIVTLIAVLPEYGTASAVVSVLVGTGVVMFIARYVSEHPYTLYGVANAVTTGRAITTAVLAGFIPIASDMAYLPDWFWAIGIVATTALCLDGLDGYLARKTQQCSAFGARFDMETDALLGLVITLLLWQSEKLGVWVLGLGLMRYAFILASVWVRILRADLYPSMRRKVVCVIQVGALCLMLCPLLNPDQATLVGIAAMLALIYSFTVDIRWLIVQAGRAVSDA